MIDKAQHCFTSKLEEILANNPVKWLTISYILALALIAAMALQVHFKVAEVIASNKDGAHVVNIAGRQRMLSQRIAMLLTEAIDNPSREVKQELLLAINSMETSHNALVHGSESLRIPTPLSEELQKHYFSPPHNLNKHVKDFIQNARIVSVAINHHISHDHFISLPEYQRVQQAARKTLLTELNQAVKIYDDEAQAQIAALYDSQEFALIIILAGLLLEAILIFRPMVKRVATHTKLVEKIANEDHLTGIYNRGAFMAHARIELQRAERHHNEATLIMFDLDYFKAINDAYGHSAGDLVLQDFTRLVSSNIRKEDIFGRFGGEEFVLFLPQTGIKGAQRVAQKVLDMLNSHELLIAESNQVIRFTSSIGIAAFSDIDNTLAKMLDRADKALYEAKNSGRNRFVTGFPQRDGNPPASGHKHLDWHI